ncbi:Diphthine methyltransferase [Galdieria sulphuraria]|nr:Diphthine methyltransferase [Galdieria sulphuraria]
MNKYDISIVAETKTFLSADVVECRYRDSEILVACGLYQFLQEEQTRVGSLQLYSLKQRGYFTLEHSWDLPAVLDCQWLDSDHIAVACANGTVVLVKYTAQESDNNPISSFLVDSHSLILSLDYSPKNNMIICSDSLGNLSLIDAFTGVKQNTYKAHSAEGWCAAFYDEVLCCSGGDDGLLTLWDIRCRTGSSHQLNMEPLKTVTSSHSGIGITSILPVFNSNVLLTGGYDDHLVGHDIRMLCKSLFAYNVGGGVWRLGQDGNRPSNFLAATMYDGFKFFRLDYNSDFTIDLHRFGESASTIAYGVCWLPLEKDSEAITCTFYDGLLQHWKIQDRVSAQS